MSNLLVFVLAFAALTMLVNTASLFSAKEGFRGMGRIFGGVSTFSLGVFVHAVGINAHAGSLVQVCAVVIALSGLVAFGSGIRKYRRRNITQG